MSTSLFVDGSVDPRAKVGFGAYLSFNSDDLIHLSQSACVTEHHQASLAMNSTIHLKRFENTSSTKLEIEALLWALEQLPNTERVTVYTDCQNVVGLPARKERLEALDYCSAKGKPLALASHYRQFFKCCDTQSITFVKLDGHKPASRRTAFDHLFSSVDRAARQACRDCSKRL